MKFLNESILEGTSGESSIEAAIDTLPNLTSFGSAGATIDIDAGTLDIDVTGTTLLDTTSLHLTNTSASDTNTGGKINLVCDDGAAMADNHQLGRLGFWGAEDAGNTLRQGAYISCIADALWSGTENGASLLFVTTDANDSQSTVLTLDSDKLATFTGDVNINNATTSSATEGGIIKLISDDGAALGDDHRLGLVSFKAAEDGSGTLRVGAQIAAFADAAWSTTENGTRMVFSTNDADNSLSTVLTLDSDKLATFAGAVTVTGDLTADVINGTLATVSQTNITGVGTIGTGVWQGTAITKAYINADQGNITTLGTIGTGTWQGTKVASAYLDDDTAHLTTDQTFSGIKTFTRGTIFDNDKNVTPGDGAVIHVDAHDITDTNTSASGTAAMYTHVNIENPRLMATNASVTTTAAASLYIKGAPVASTNQTITNPYALWVDAGLVKFDGALTVGGTITGDVTGDISGQAGTVATIAGLAPNTATTQATQPNIESIGTAGDSLDILGDVVNIYNATASKPDIQMTNQTDDASGPFITMINRRVDSSTQAGEDGDDLGTIQFGGYDDQGTPAFNYYASILAEIHDATSGEESGKLTLSVANHDAGMGAGLILTGGGANNTIDVDLGLGATSVTNIKGSIDCGGAMNIPASHSYDIDDTAIISDSSGTATLSNIDAIDATTASTLKAALYARSTISFLGQATMLSSGNWVGPNANGISNHIYNLDFGVNTETNGTSAASIAKQYGHAGIRMPYACVIESVYAAIRNGSGNRQVTVGLFCARAADGTTAVDWGTTDATEPILQIHADANNESGSYQNRPVHAEAAVDIVMAAGDMFYPAIKLTGVTSSGNTDNVYANFSVGIKTLIV